MTLEQEACNFHTMRHIERVRNLLKKIGHQLGLEHPPPKDKTFIYVLVDPLNHHVRYLGKTTEAPSNRLRRHLEESKRINNHRCNWIKSLHRKGLRPLIEVIDLIDTVNWKTEEREWISELRAIGVHLTNGTDGGEGSYGRVFSKETLVKMSNSQSGKKRSQEHIENLRKAITGRVVSQETKNKLSASLKGRTYSAETLEKMRTSHLGKKLTEENKRKLRESNLGKKRSAETCMKIRLAKKGHGLGRKLPAEQIAKIATSNTGKVCSEETKAKIRMANLGKNLGGKLSEETKAKMRESQQRRRAREKK